MDLFLISDTFSLLSLYSPRLSSSGTSCNLILVCVVTVKRRDFFLCLPSRSISFTLFFLVCIPFLSCLAPIPFSIVAYAWCLHPNYFIYTNMCIHSLLISLNFAPLSRSPSSLHAIPIFSDFVGGLLSFPVCNLQHQFCLFVVASATVFVVRLVTVPSWLPPVLVSLTIRI